MSLWYCVPMYYNKRTGDNAYIIVDFLSCFGFQLFVKVTDYFFLSTAHADLRSLLSQEANGLTRTKVIALHGNKETGMMMI